VSTPPLPPDADAHTRFEAFTSLTVNTNHYGDPRTGCMMDEQVRRRSAKRALTRAGMSAL